MIGLCVDSNSQMPAALADRYGIEIVPITVVVDRVAYQEGVDLDADGFWDFFEGGRIPDVGTSQPSPGEIAAAWTRLVDRGATEIVSVHVGAHHSGTINSARVATQMVDVDVHIVDTGTISFGISCCAWTAAEVVADGGSAAQAAAAAEAVAPKLKNAFVMEGLELATASGRVREAPELPPEGIAVYALTGPELTVLGGAATAEEAARFMADAVLADTPVRAAVGVADAAVTPVGDALRSALAGHDGVVDLVDYRVGPSVGAFSGPGTAGCFWFSI